MIHANLPEFQSYGALLCLDGELPPVSFLKAWPHPIVAVDGAANRLMSMGIRPAAVVGDLDTLDPIHRASLLVYPMPSQDQTDADKALDFLRSEGLWPALVVGVSGGFLDHILYNIHLMLRHGCHFYAPPLFCWSLCTPGIQHYQWEYDTKISLFGMPSAKITTRGLRWDMEAIPLTLGGMQSLSNRVQEPTVSIELHEGTLLLCRYTIPMNDGGSLLWRNKD